LASNTCLFHHKGKRIVIAVNTGVLNPELQNFKFRRHASLLRIETKQEKACSIIESNNFNCISFAVICVDRFYWGFFFLLAPLQQKRGGQEKFEYRHYGLAGNFLGKFIRS
jgi:hypothetical protein